MTSHSYQGKVRTVPFASEIQSTHFNAFLPHPLSFIQVPIFTFPIILLQFPCIKATL